MYRFSRFQLVLSVLLVLDEKKEEKVARIDFYCKIKKKKK